MLNTIPDPGVAPAGIEHANSDQSYLRVRGLSVDYGKVRALDNVDMDVSIGRIHAVLGENGAGKSTLLKSLAGTQPASEGTIEIDGRIVTLSSPGAARAAGISCVFQEMSLIQDLSVAENIQLAAPPRRMGLIDKKEESRRAKELLDLVGADDVSPHAFVRDLPLSRRQLVEIAKGLACNPRVLILDESTSALTEHDSQHILKLARQLADRGLAILYVSHRMGEIEQLADDCTIFRDGRKVDSFVFKTKTRDDMVKMMMGRAVDASLPKPAPLASNAETIMRLKNLSWAPALNGVELALRRGEVLGIGGLDGQGQHEILLAIFGALKGLDGEIELAGIPATKKQPFKRMTAAPRMAYVPEDRGSHGLVQSMSVGDNILLCDTDGYASDLVRKTGKSRERIKRAIERLKIRVSSSAQPAHQLSGGNQQKIVLAKWLECHPEIFLLDDPTRGIDIGTKKEIFHLLHQLASEGCGILLYSSDQKELCQACHRVLVLYEGRIVSMLEGDALTEENLVNAAFNLSKSTNSPTTMPDASSRNP